MTCAEISGIGKYPSPACAKVALLEKRRQLRFRVQGVLVFTPSQEDGQIGVPSVSLTGVQAAMHTSQELVRKSAQAHLNTFIMVYVKIRVDLRPRYTSFAFHTLKVECNGSCSKQG